MLNHSQTDVPPPRIQVASRTQRPHRIFSTRTRRPGSANATTENVTTSAPTMCVLVVAGPARFRIVGAAMSPIPTNVLNHRFHGAENASMPCKMFEN